MRTFHGKALMAILVFQLGATTATIHGSPLVAISATVEGVRNALSLLEEGLVDISGQLDRVEKLTLIQIQSKISGAVKSTEEALELKSPTDQRRALLLALSIINEGIEASKATSLLFAESDYDFWLPHTHKDAMKRAWTSLWLASSVQQLYWLKVRTLEVLGEQRNIASTYADYASDMRDLRGALIPAIFFLQQSHVAYITPEEVQGRMVAPNLIYIFCDAEMVHGYYTGELKKLSFAYEALADRAKCGYAELTCLLSTILNWEEGKYDGVEQAEARYLLAMEIYENHDLEGYAVVRQSFADRYSAFIQRTRAVFNDLKEQRLARPAHLGFPRFYPKSTCP